MPANRTDSVLMVYNESDMKLPKRQIVAGETVRYPIHSGQLGINRTMIPRMIEIVREEHAQVRQAAVDAIGQAQCGGKDQACQAKAIYDWVLSRAQWIQDPALEETLIYPTRLIREMANPPAYADCASLNMLLVALLGSVGIRAAFVFGSDGYKDADGEPIIYHVWTMVPIDGKFFYLEPTVPCPAGKAKKYSAMYVQDPWA